MAISKEYELFQSNYAALSCGMAQAVVAVANKALEKRLIGPETLAKAMNKEKTAEERASDLAYVLLSRVQVRSSDFYVILDILKGIPTLSHLVQLLEPGYAPEEAMQASGQAAAALHASGQAVSQASWQTAASQASGQALDSSYVSPGMLPAKQLGKEHARRQSDSEVIRSKPKHTTEADSGFSGLAGGDFIPEVYFESTFVSESQNCDYNNSLTVAEASVLTRAKLPMSPLPKRTTSALVLSHTDSASNGSTFALNATPQMEGVPYNDEYVGVEDEDFLQRASTDGAPPPKPGVISFENSNAWNRDTENKYLKSQTEVQNSEISDLKQTLKEEKASSAKKLKQQKLDISQKDDVITSLKKECKEKDDRVTDLKKDKAEMEKKIENLEKRCSEAETKQEKSEEEIKRVHESYKAELDKLQKDLEEVESREKTAQIDLANAKTKLSDALLEKERAISKLKEEFHEQEKLQEKIKHELELSKQKLEEEKKVEHSLKDKELAVKDKELAVKDKELAEGREKRALEKASHDRQEAERANDELRKSDLEVLELKEKLKKLELRDN